MTVCVPVVVVFVDTAQAAHPVPVERKRATSGEYYWNDEVQLTGYCLLIEAAHESVARVAEGEIYLYSTDEVVSTALVSIDTD